MPIDPQALGPVGGPVTASWSSADCLLYALGVGAGVSDPAGFELEFTTENSVGLTQRVLPTFPVVLPLGAQQVFDHIGPFDLAMLLHGAQELTLHAPLPVDGIVTADTTVTGIFDKGTAAVVTYETTASATGAHAGGSAPLFSLGSTLFIRGEGGWGGDRGPSTRWSAPDRAPDHTVTYATRPDQALLYRLNGDRNPLHSDPKFAAAAGLERPILHGLCAYGFIGRALLHTLCGSDPDSVRFIGGRFSKPVLPGDSLTTRIWELDGGEAAFQTSTQPGDVIFDAGVFRYSRD